MFSVNKNRKFPRTMIFKNYMNLTAGFISLHTPDWNLVPVSC